MLRACGDLDLDWVVIRHRSRFLRGQLEFCLEIPGLGWVGHNVAFKAWAEGDDPLKKIETQCSRVARRERSKFVWDRSDTTCRKRNAFPWRSCRCHHRSTRWTLASSSERQTASLSFWWTCTQRSSLPAPWRPATYMPALNTHQRASEGLKFWGLVITCTCS